MLDRRVGVTMDSQSGVVVAFDARFGRTWTFDVSTNTWHRMDPPREPLLKGRARMVYDADADLIIAFPDRDTPWTYSVETDAWTMMPVVDPQPNSTFSVDDLAYDSLSGRVLLRDSRTTELWSYAVETNRWTQVNQGGGEGVPTENPDQVGGAPHFHSLLSYDAVADRLVLTLLGEPKRGQTWTFDTRFGAWAKRQASPPALNTSYFESGGEAVFDAARGVTVVFSDGVLATYGAVADEWTTIQPGPGWPSVGSADGFLTGPLARLGHWLVYDPVNERIVMLGGRARMPGGWRDVRDVWAYDLSANKWLELVPERPE